MGKLSKKLEIKKNLENMTEDEKIRTINNNMQQNELTEVHALAKQVMFDVYADKIAHMDKNEPTYKEIQQLLEVAETHAYNRDVYIERQKSHFPTEYSPGCGTFLAGLASAVGGALSGLIANGIGRGEMAKHYLEIHNAQQGYVSEVKTDLYNQFGMHLYSGPENLVQDILFQAKTTSNDIASRYLMNYAGEVQATLDQIAVDVVGIDYGMIAVKIGVAVVATLFATHMAGRTYVRYSRKKKINQLGVKIQNIYQQVNHKFEKLKEINEDKNKISAADTVETTQQTEAQLQY